jgi:hypothetical protein
LGIAVTIIMTVVTLKCGSPPAQPMVNVNVPVTLPERANRSPGSEARPAVTGALWDPGCRQPQDENLLPEEEAMVAINKALAEGDVASAFCHLAGSRDEAWMRRERNRVFEYCLRNNKLSEAETMTQTWWRSSEAEDKRVMVQRLREKLPRR